MTVNEVRARVCYERAAPVQIITARFAESKGCLTPAAKKAGLFGDCGNQTLSKVKGLFLGKNYI